MLETLIEALKGVKLPDLAEPDKSLFWKRRKLSCRNVKSNFLSSRVGMASSRKHFFRVRSKSAVLSNSPSHE